MTSIILNLDTVLYASSIKKRKTTTAQIQYQGNVVLVSVISVFNIGAG